MKLTKYGHACLFIESDSGSKLVIDPGCFTKLPDELDNISVAIITEEHVDHFNLENVQKIVKINPDVKILTTKNVALELSEESIESTPVSHDFSKKIGDFEINLKQVNHAVVHKVSPCKSLTVQIGDYLYYPSDSYTVTAEEVEILALPTSGPWYKVTESIDFMNAVKSRKIIATHNAINSEAGNKVTNNFITTHLTDKSRQWLYLEDGDSL